MTTTTLPRFKRYYGDDGKVSMEVDKSSFLTLLHAAYTHWVRSNHHLRDFNVAVGHVVSMALGTYLLDGEPQLTGDMPAPPSLKLAVHVVRRNHGPQQRFYDEINAISPEIDLSHLEQAVHYGFVKWMADGYHPRDFAQFAQDCSSILVYDHMLTQALGGLGGGRSEEQFLTEPYHG
jgi:hypothetical protein